MHDMGTSKHVIPFLGTFSHPTQCSTWINPTHLLSFGISSIFLKSLSSPPAFIAPLRPLLGPHPLSLPVILYYNCQLWYASFTTRLSSLEVELCLSCSLLDPQSWIRMGVK